MPFSPKGIIYPIFSLDHRFKICDTDLKVERKFKTLFRGFVSQLYRSNILAFFCKMANTMQMPRRNYRHDRCNWFFVGLQMIKCILYTLHVIHYTVYIPFFFHCEKITEIITFCCNTKTNVFYFFVKDPSTIPPFLLYKKILECTLWILKNIPVSICAQYKCLPFLFNKQFTTHSLTVNLCIQSCLLREISLLSGNFPCES